MKNTKTFKVIMLSTEKVINQPNWYFPATKTLVIDRKQQHLYILSDEEIKEGDWYYNSVFNTIEQLQYQKNQNTLTSFDKKVVVTTDKSLTIPYMTNYGAQREVGGVNQVKELPQIPESFIQAYIKAYNEGKPITEVDLEIDIMNTTIIGITDKYRIKTRSDNTVITHPTGINSKYPYRVGKKQGRAVLNNDGQEEILFPIGKEKEAQEYCDFLNNKMYSKEEVIELCSKAFNSGYELAMGDIGVLDKYIDKWIEKNL